MPRENSNRASQPGVELRGSDVLYRIAALQELGVFVYWSFLPSASGNVIHRNATDLAIDGTSAIHHREFIRHSSGVVANSHTPRERHRKSPNSRLSKLRQLAGRVERCGNAVSAAADAFERRPVFVGGLELK
jgi:hypothetical protein